MESLPYLTLEVWVSLQCSDLLPIWRKLSRVSIVEVGYYCRYRAPRPCDLVGFLHPDKHCLQ